MDRHYAASRTNADKIAVEHSKDPILTIIKFSSLITSLVRDYIPVRVRIIVQLAIIASLVTLVSEFLKAFNYELFKVLGAFVGVIITNCIILQNNEFFAKTLEST